ncbi:hypothetical protein [Dendrosporobacter sp. 1207_IL3150]|uniref:hypothetical protein n=1 Tax=Dendrosporobacter sp. 1207_IL3150 TaxID=3084054 RepID=UPI002FD87FE5
MAMRKFIHNVILGLLNIITIFILMAAPVVALIYLSKPLDAAVAFNADTRKDIPVDIQNKFTKESNLFDAELNKKYSEMSGTPTTIDIVKNDKKSEYDSNIESRQP